MRWIPVAIGFLLVAFGIACLNYTKPGTFQRHQEWAREHAKTAPGNTVFWGGGTSTAIGAFVLGFSVASRKTART